MRDIGTRVEMFIDRWLIDRLHTATLKMHAPERREVVLTLDQPWEGPATAYFSVFQDGPLVRMYYRGRDQSKEMEGTCYAESTDGISFTRPSLGLFEFDGARENNIILREKHVSHNFAAFLDANPAAKPEERYKALGGSGMGDGDGLHAYASADGIHWKPMAEHGVVTGGAFDSQNIAFWDSIAGCYRCYSRYFSPNWRRCIQSCTSTDFLTWTPQAPNVYAAPAEEFYTNATLPCPGAEHILLSFPKRFFKTRHKISEHPKPGLSDTVLMTSRDGVTWDRTFPEAWARPGRDPRNWTQRGNMTAHGIVATTPEEFSLYISEHYSWEDNRLRRLTVRRHGFASVNAGARGGEMLTQPLIFGGDRLRLNYATSAGGSVRVEIRDADGKRLPGFRLADMAPLYGDELDAVIAWKSGSDLSALRGTPVRFRIVLEDADLFAVQTPCGE